MGPALPPATSSAADDLLAPLEWAAFCERHFPGRLRHDREAVTAYAAYRRNWAPAV
jgi:hypothetical protein